jgi:formylglycine-generating enzyme required for sulfatase activity
MNYAAFMRYAIRGSLKAKYSMKNLGFRCVQDVKTSSQENQVSQ